MAYKQRIISTGPGLITRLYGSGDPFIATGAAVDVDYIEYSVPGSGPCHHHTFSRGIGPWSGIANARNSDIPEFSLVNVYDGAPGNLGHIIVGGINSNTAKLLAATNPGRSSVSIPNFIYELKDLPGMLRLDGINLLSLRDPRGSAWALPANAYLSGKFGWGPLIGDLLKMLDWQKSVNNRIRQIIQARERPVSRKLVYGSQSNSFTYRNENFVWGRGDITLQTDYSEWGSVRWVPTPLALSGAVPPNVQAFLSNFSLDQPLAVLWAALPWSWMIDWFANVSQYIQATSNTLFWYPTDIWLHRKAISRSELGAVRVFSSGGDLSLKPGVNFARDYYRTPASAPYLEASLPFLSEGQVTTAVALIAQRVRAPR